MNIFVFFFVVFVSCDKYRAAIAQFENLFNPVSMFIPLIEKAESEKVDILVFPEAGVHESFYEKVDEGSFPCGDPEKPVQSNISCQAKSSKLYVVFDLIERGEECTHGTEYCNKKLGFYVYNTAVVMDRNGYVIERYRKHHPFTPGAKFFKPGPANVSHFETDFGVHFGLFICFDILWKVPEGDVVRKFKINNILFPTHWVDTLFADASEIQQGYSQYFQTNLIAANDLTTSFGSGIFSKGLPIVVNDELKDKLIIADVLIFEFIPPPEQGPSKKFEWSQKVDIHSFKAVPKKQGKISSNLETHTCEFSYGVKEGKGDIFAVGAVRFERVGVKIEACIFLNCGSSSPSMNCSINRNPEAVFDYLRVNMTSIDDLRIVLPLISTTGRAPIQKKSFEDIIFLHNGNNHAILMNQIEDPISFAVHFGLKNFE